MSSRQRYEHRRVYAANEDHVRTISQWEQQGWELCAMNPWKSPTSGAWMYFKRPSTAGDVGTADGAPR